LGLKLGIKRDATDKAFSDAIREAANYVCQRCSLDFRHNPGGFDCSHVKSRKYVSCRFFEKNALALCRSCHTKMAESPAEHIELYIRIWGEEGYQELLDHYNRTDIRLRKADKLAIRKHWQGELERMRLMRMQGKQGVIELIGWDYK